MAQAAPFLPVRDDFHPKRNQARQKLATLPRNRFKDLASDVFYELRRRFPEFEESEVSALGEVRNLTDISRNHQTIAQRFPFKILLQPQDLDRVINTSPHRQHPCLLRNLLLTVLRPLHLNGV